MDKMSRLILATLMLNSSFALATDNTISTRIVGGTESIEGNWPWMVQVIAGGIQCGGTLIDNRTVMTAAHCLYNNEIEVAANRISVHIGAYDLTENIPSTGIAQTYIHSNYDPSNSASSNDIALLRLATPVDDITTLNRADTITTTDAVSFKGSVTVLGWGSTVGYEPGQDVTPIYPTILRQVSLPLQSDSDCRMNVGSSYNSATMVCAGDVDGGEDSCQGDSGGPLLLNNNGNWQQLGIVSWGAGCAAAGSPGVYTRVATYNDWINSFIEGITIDNQLDYGLTVIGDSKQRDLLINNNSTTQASLTFLLNGSDEFTFDASTCAIIDANSLCKLPITFTPVTQSGSNAILTINSDIAGAQPLTTPLSGNVIITSSSSGGGSIFFILTLPLLLLRRFIGK